MGKVIGSGKGEAYLTMVLLRDSTKMLRGRDDKDVYKRVVEKNERLFKKELSKYLEAA